jgi:hypothetical protein
VYTDSISDARLRATTRQCRRCRRFLAADPGGYSTAIVQWQVCDVCHAALFSQAALFFEARGVDPVGRGEHGDR